LFTIDIRYSSITAEYPCLKSRTGTEGWEALKASLKFKMGNVRGKLRQADCLEALVNAGKRSKFKPHLAAPHKGIKKARRGEANYLPDTVAGTDSSSTDELHKLQECMMATTKDLTTINKLMVSTYAVRRRLITEQPTLVKEILTVWPALFLPNQVFNSISL
jgi:hypothetical protein